MNSKELEYEIVKALKINTEVNWDVGENSPNEEFKMLIPFVRKLFKDMSIMDFKNLAYPFEDVGDAPFNVVRILNECYNDYSNGNLGDGEHMARGLMVREEFLRRIAQIGYDELKFQDIADTLESDVDENNAHLASKYYEPPETNEEDDEV